MPLRIAAYGIFLAAALGVACEPASRNDGGCETNNDCEPGFVCATGTCIRLCTVQSDCAEGKLCVEQTCVAPVEGALPDVQRVAGNGVADGARVVDGVVIRGTTLGNATFELRGQDRDVPLRIRRQSDTEVEAVFPADVRSGQYALVATNAAGSDEASVELLLPELRGDAIIQKINAPETNGRIDVAKVSGAQARVDGACNDEQSISAINADGTVACEDDSVLAETDVEGLIANDLNTGALPYATENRLGDTSIFFDDAENRVGIGTSKPAKKLHVGAGYSYELDSIGTLSNMQGQRCPCDDEASPSSVDCADEGFTSETDSGAYCYDARAGEAAQFVRSPFRGLTVSEQGHVGASVENPTAALSVGGNVVHRHGGEMAVIRKLIVKDDLPNNEETPVLRITTPNRDGSTDGGGYIVKVQGLVGHGISQTTGSVATRPFSAWFARAIRGGGDSASTSDVVVEVNGPNAKVGGRGIADVSLIPREDGDTQHQLTVSLQVDLTSSTSISIANGHLAATVEVLWYKFGDPPVVEAL